MRIFSILAVLFALQVLSSYAQQPDWNKIEAITTGIEKGDTQAMLEAGRSGGGRHSIYVEPLQKFVEKAQYAELALAKLGDQKAFAKILAEAESEDYGVAVFAVSEKLPYLGGPESIRVLAKIILNPKSDIPPPSSGDQVFVPIVDCALKAFVNLVPEAPVSKNLAGGNPIFLWYKREEIRAWIRDHPKYWK